MNGMIQLMVKEEDRPALMRLFPWDMDNTLHEKQRGHHVTLAFKPSDEESEGLKVVFGNGAWFQPDRVLADEQIAAVFGDLYNPKDGVCLRRDVHVTLGGTVPPKEANRLLDRGEVVDSGFEGGMQLDFHTVDFE